MLLPRGCDQFEPVAELGVPLALEELKGCFGVPSSEEKTTKEMVQFDAEESQEKASSFSMGEFFQELAGMASGLPNDM